MNKYHINKNISRIPWVDSAKGMAMLLIIWGHVQEPSTLYSWITSFHVQVFLVLTGILLARKGEVGGVENYLAN